MIADVFDAWSRSGWLHPAVQVIKAFQKFVHSEKQIWNWEETLKKHAELKQMNVSCMALLHFNSTSWRVNVTAKNKFS